MDELTYKIEHDFAKKRLDKVIASVPVSLLDRENNLLPRFEKSKRNSIHKLKQLYDFMDKLFHHVNKNLECKNGCSHCCYYAVNITELEAQYIERINRVRINRVRVPYICYHCLFGL